MIDSCTFWKASQKTHCSPSVNNWKQLNIIAPFHENNDSKSIIGIVVNTSTHNLKQTPVLAQWLSILGYQRLHLQKLSRCSTHK